MRAGFGFLAQATYNFAQTDGQCRNGFKALLAAVWEAPILFAADLREQQLRIAQNPGERIIHLMAEHLAERLSPRTIDLAIKQRLPVIQQLASDINQVLRLAQTPLHSLQCDGEATLGTRYEIRRSSRHKSGHFAFLI